MGMQIHYELQCLPPIGGFADNRELAHVSENRNQTLSENGVIIGNQDSYGLLLHTSAAVSGGFSPNSVYRFTLPKAAMIESEIPTCRDFIASRNSRISRRTLSFSLHTQAIGRNP